MMIRLRWLLLLFLSSLASAQFTTVTGTVLDPNSIPYSNGTITATLVSSATPIFTATNLPYAPPTQPVGLNAAGAFVMRLADVTALTPGGSTWTFRVCSAGGTVQPGVGAGPVCFTVTGVAIAGASQDITATLHAAALALTIPLGGSTPAAPPNAAQYNNAGALGGVLLGTGQFLTGTAAAPVAQSKAVIDVRDYGAVPDGATDSSAAITAAFTAANAVASGSPTVYFGCNSASATCQYNYGGAGTSPINPTIPMTIACAPNVMLNYTGTAHAADIGGATNIYKLYKIQDCGFTGAASSTEGLYITNGAQNVQLLHNYFQNFGNQTGYAVYCVQFCQAILMEGNQWISTDNSVRQIFYDAASQFNFLQFTDNQIACFHDPTTGGACPITPTVVGLFVAPAGYLTGNSFLGNNPNIRMSSVGGGATFTVQGNTFNINTSSTTPCITYGNPGGTAANMASGIFFYGNAFFCPVAINTPNIIGPETPAAGSYSLNNSIWMNNFFRTDPTGTGVYINANGGGRNTLLNNLNSSQQILMPGSVAPMLIDAASRGNVTQWYATSSGTPLDAGVLTQWGTNTSIAEATFHVMAAMLTCSDTSGSGTTQLCQTIGATHFTTPVAGDCIVYHTTTTNTGALTLNVNGVGAIAVQKRQGTVALAAGDLVNTSWTPLCMNSAATAWELLDPITQ